MNISIRALTPCRSLTDIHLMGKQDEGIEGFDPVRHRRFVAGVYVDTNGHNIEKVRSFIGIHYSIHNCATMLHMPRRLILKMMKI